MSTERRGVRILIVEDEPKLAAVMADYLHIEGFETTSISDGAEVIPFIRTTPPSLCPGATAWIYAVSYGSSPRSR
jgi:two-component system response regulator BaeR